MDRLCPVCGAPCSPDEKFCRSCGARLPESAPAAPVYAAPAAPVSPAAPAYEAPAAPKYEAPAAPAYAAPAAPQAAPTYQPAPTYQAAPTYQPAPAYQAASAYQRAPAYPAAPSAPAPKKKKKTGLIVGLCAGGAVLLLAALAVVLYFFVFSPSSVTLSRDSVTIKCYDSVNLTAEVNPGTALNKDVTWKSDDEDVASVAYDGTVTGWEAGTCTITATASNGKSASCTVKVEVDPTALTLSAAVLDLEPGGSQTLTATVQPENAVYDEITWTSDDPSVATVSDGTVTAVGNGSCTVTAAVSDSVKATCRVTVGVAATGIDLSDYSVDLRVGETQTLTAEVFPENATGYTVTWTSDDPSVATVSDGIITAVGAGSCTVRASLSEDIYMTCYVDVSAAIADSEYDSYILGNWRLTLIYDWDTGVDSPASSYSTTGSVTFYSDHTGRYTMNDESFDITWGFDELSDFDSVSRYGFWLDFGSGDYYYFDYIVNDGEIWLYDYDIEFTYTFER